jgi:hypothetical protein
VLHRISTLLAVVLSVLLAPTAFTAPLRVKVCLLDTKTGKPLKKTAISLIGYNGIYNYKTTQLSVFLLGLTNKEGAALFTVPDPLPEHIGFVTDATTTARCWSESFTPQVIGQTGAVGPNICSGAPVGMQVKANPDEVVLFAKRFTLWHKILREIP